MLHSVSRFDIKVGPEQNQFSCVPCFAQFCEKSRFSSSGESWNTSQSWNHLITCGYLQISMFFCLCVYRSEKWLPAETGGLPTRRLQKSKPKQLLSLERVDFHLAIWTSLHSVKTTPTWVSVLDTWLSAPPPPFDWQNCFPTDPESAEDYSSSPHGCYIVWYFRKPSCSGFRVLIANTKLSSKSIAVQSGDRHVEKCWLIMK